MLQYQIPLLPLSLSVEVASSIRNSARRHGPCATSQITPLYQYPIDAARPLYHETNAIAMKKPGSDEREIDEVKSRQTSARLSRLATHRPSPLLVPFRNQPKRTSNTPPTTCLRYDKHAHSKRLSWGGASKRRASCWMWRQVGSCGSGNSEC